MGIWESFDDIEYRGYLLSVYACFTEEKEVIEYEIRVREGNGLDENGEWLEALYIARFETYGEAVKSGKGFVDGLYLMRALGVGDGRNS